RDYPMGWTGMSDKLRRQQTNQVMGFLPLINTKAAAPKRIVSQAAAEESEPDRWFGPKADIQTVAHAKTGELYYLDTMTMRMRQCPADKQLQHMRRRSSQIEVLADGG
ncbi:unnamed protein product, partial [Effrenium voratum]